MLMFVSGALFGGVLGVATMGVFARTRSSAMQQIVDREQRVRELLVSTLRSLLPLLKQERRQRQASGIAEYEDVARRAVVMVEESIAIAEGWL